MTPGRPPAFERGDAGPLLGLVALGLTLFAGTAWLAARGAGVSMSALAAYYDGYLYLDIARSFPVPFDAAGRAYAGQAPGYPAVAALFQVLLPGDGWALPMLLPAWLGGALATVAFFSLCRSCGTSPFWPSLLFLLANPTATYLAATAHPEPLALALATASLAAFARDRPLACFAWLAAATLCRYPALLLTGPLALGFVVLRGRRDARVLLGSALPALAVAAVHGYLAWRIPGFTTVFDAHRAFWDHRPTWPFASLVEYGLVLWAALPLTLTLAYALMLAYAAGIALGFRERERALRVLPLWIATVVVFPFLLSGPEPVFAFARLSQLAWPALVLVLWRRADDRVPPAAAGAAAAALGVFGVWYAADNLRGAVRVQGDPAVIERFVAVAAPVWLDLETRAPGGLAGHVERALARDERPSGEASGP